MMNVFSHQWGSVLATVYVLAPGEKVPRHQHSADHSMTVGNGSVTVQMWTIAGTRGFLGIYGYGQSAVLPRDIDHEITAGEDGAIILNMISIEGSAATAGAAGQAGGVAFAEGHPPSLTVEVP